MYVYMHNGIYNIYKLMQICSYVYPSFYVFAFIFCIHHINMLLEISTTYWKKQCLCICFCISYTFYALVFTIHFENSFFSLRYSQAFVLCVCFCIYCTFCTLVFSIRFKNSFGLFLEPFRSSCSVCMFWYPLYILRLSIQNIF